MNSALEIALAFVERINAQDVDGLGTLMTEDHRFLDSLGQEVVGREAMRTAWRGYFQMFPDYRIAITDSFVHADRVALFGTTSATYAPSKKRVEVHAAWLAVVRGDRIAEWRVYADNEPARAARRG